MRIQKSQTHQHYQKNCNNFQRMLIESLWSLHCVRSCKLTNIWERALTAGFLYTHHVVAFSVIQIDILIQLCFAEPCEDIHLTLSSTLFVGLKGEKFRELSTRVYLPANFSEKPLIPYILAPNIISKADASSRTSLISLINASWGAKCESTCIDTCSSLERAIYKNREEETEDYLFETH